MKEWKVFVSKLNVATQRSGQVVGTTRGKVNEILATGNIFSLIVLHHILNEFLISQNYE